MDHEYTDDRVRSLSEISHRHQAREIEGCTSWRHHAVHRDRAWLLHAIDRLRAQAQRVREARSASQTGADFELELNELLRLLEEPALDHLGD